MAGRQPAPKGGIEAASRTYIRCTNLLREEFGVPPLDLGCGPRETFEATVTRLRAMLVSLDESSPKSLAQEDFSFNDVLRLMRLTAIECAKPKMFYLKREDFIRRVNETMEKEGRLKAAGRLVPKAKTGRYAWIESHMHTFLRRNSDVVQRSDQFPDSLQVVIVR